MKAKKIKQFDMARDFTRYPSGRSSLDGQYSGEIFRTKVLIPAITNRIKIIINLDSAIGYGSSFLEEAFGGLVRAGVTRNDIENFIKISTRDKSLELEIEKYISEALCRSEGN